jgi:hypothetical protein
MAKITLDVPDELHFQMKDRQLELEKEGIKKNLKDMYYEIVEKGLNCSEKETTPLAKNTQD